MAAATELDLYAVRSVMAQAVPGKIQAIVKNPTCLSGSNATAARAQDGSYARLVKEWERSFPIKQAHPRHDPNRTIRSLMDAAFLAAGPSCRVRGSFEERGLLPACQTFLTPPMGTCGRHCPRARNIGSTGRIRYTPSLWAPISSPIALPVPSIDYSC